MRNLIEREWESFGRHRIDCLAWRRFCRCPVDGVIGVAMEVDALERVGTIGNCCGPWRCRSIVDVSDGFIVSINNAKTFSTAFQSTVKGT